MKRAMLAILVFLVAMSVGAQERALADADSVEGEPRGRVTDVLLGALGGALLGAAVFGGLGYAMGDDRDTRDSEDWQLTRTAGQKARFFGAVGGMLGLAMGLMVSLEVVDTETQHVLRDSPGAGASVAVVGLRNRSLLLALPHLTRRISPIDGTVLQKVDVLRVRF